MRAKRSTQPDHVARNRIIAIFRIELDIRTIGDVADLQIWDVERGTRHVVDFRHIDGTGDVQLGLVEFLEGQTGVKARAGLSGADGRFVRLTRG